MSKPKRAAFALLLLGFRLTLGVAEMFRRRSQDFPKVNVNAEARLPQAVTGHRHSSSTPDSAQGRTGRRGEPEPFVDTLVSAARRVTPSTYAVITPARDEATSLPELARCLGFQSLRPETWLIVENGSTDGTPGVAAKLASQFPWVNVETLTDPGPSERGAPIVRALHAGIDALRAAPPDVVVNVDADVTMDSDYFEQLIERFDADPTLGIASGSALELEPEGWRQRFVTGGTVWGATRAYRWSCLEIVTPLEARHGWDGIDQLKARAGGWRTATFTDLHFRHHRTEGARDGSRWAHWCLNGETAHYMGYRPSYLVARALHQSRREMSALGLVWGFAQSALGRRTKLQDEAARAILREDQRFRNLLHRRREALGSE